VNTENSSNDGEYYTDNELARLLGISLGRLRNKLPKTLVLNCRVDGEAYDIACSILNTITQLGMPDGHCVS
jgi:hypothetical protein